MHHARLLATRAVVLLLPAIAAGCTRLVDVNLTLAEPCGQENQALNGVSSFRILSSGADSDGVVGFTADQAQTLQMGLGEKVIVAVEAYAADITQGGDVTAPTVAPQSVGATMPLSIDAGRSAVEGVVLVGKVDSFGAPRSVDGECTAMTRGAAIPGRHGHTATYLPKINKVLLFGGAVWSADGTTESFLKSAEVYDPATGTFSALPEPRHARAYHTATALPDGRVLILGGFSVLNGATAPNVTGVVVDVNADAPYVKLLSMRLPRAHHTATLLEDVGIVAIIGGCTGTSLAGGCGPDRAAGGSATTQTRAIEYVKIDEIGDTTLAAEGSLDTGRAMHTAVAFPGGSAGFVVVAGGLNETGALDSIEIVKLSSRGFANGEVTLGRLPEPVVRHQMVVFGDKKFAVTGGQTAARTGILEPLAPASAKATICSVVDSAGTCAGLPDLKATRFGHAMARLRNGSLIVIGGVAKSIADATVDGATAEVLREAQGTQDWLPTAGPLAVARDRAAFALLGGDDADHGFVNQIFYSGGHSTTTPYVTSSQVDIYFGGLTFSP